MGVAQVFLGDPVLIRCGCFTASATGSVAAAFCGAAALTAVDGLLVVGVVLQGGARAAAVHAVHMLHYCDGLALNALGALLHLHTAAALLTDGEGGSLVAAFFGAGVVVGVVLHGNTRAAAAASNSDNFLNGEPIAFHTNNSGCATTGATVLDLCGLQLIKDELRLVIANTYLRVGGKSS